jgi:hypothetical protein
MHAFVPAILLRLARFDAFRRNAQTDPPNRQSREACCRRREWDAIVRADTAGHLKEPAEDGLSLGEPWSFQAVTAQQVTTVVIMTVRG